MLMNLTGSMMSRQSGTREHDIFNIRPNKSEVWHKQSIANHHDSVIAVAPRSSASTMSSSARLATGFSCGPPCRMRDAVDEICLTGSNAVVKGTFEVELRSFLDLVARQTRVTTCIAVCDSTSPRFCVFRAPRNRS